jgi:hypothetical protein
MKTLSIDEVRAAFYVALETHADGDGNNEHEVMNFELLTRALNDALENE